MKVFNFNWALIIAICIVISSCDKVETPIAKEPDPIPVNPIDTFKRTILVESFTGLGCGFCPRADETLEDLLDDYEGQLVSISYHAGAFANPDPDSGLNPFPNDFRTPEGDEIYETFIGDAGDPFGLVSRSSIISDDTSMLYIGHSQWEAATIRLYTRKPIAKINLTSSYDGGGNSLTIESNTTIAQDINGQYNLCFALVEDKVVTQQADFQFNPPFDVNQNYEQMFMFRAGMNGTWGEELINGSASAGDELSLTISNFDMDPIWNADECYVVAYLYDVTTREVMQAERVKVIEQ